MDSGFIFNSFLDTWTFGASEGLASRTLVARDQLSATMGYGSDLQVPLVRGMPYVTLKYQSRTPTISTIHAINTINGIGDASGSVTDTRFRIELNNGQTWIFYASQSMTLNWSDKTSLTASAPFTGNLRAAVLFGAASETDLDTYSGKIPTGGSVAASSTGDVATITFNWVSEGTGELLMMALPHQLDVLSGAQLTSTSYNTMKGDMIGVVGESWSMNENLTPIQWYAPNGVDPARQADIISALNEDLGFQVAAPDPYFAGKEMAALARLALIAEELGETALAQQYRDKVRPVLESWLDATNVDPLIYDQSWGGIVSTNGIFDPGADFGQGYYNDHHFHYGYHIYTAAVIAKADASWAAQYDEKVISLIRDIAEPSGADPYFTMNRNKDWFAGKENT